jgi:Uma2 family endonuclease
MYNWIVLLEKTMVKTPTRSIPLFLENGDRLSRAEFERRSALMPESQKVELIEGVVYVAAALRYRSHAQPHGIVMTWLGVYASATPGVEFADNPTVRLDLDNQPQPDAVLRIDRSRGGQSSISDDDYLEGAPELVIEIAASSAAYDLYEKKRVYRRNSVQEYIIWQVYDRRISWFSLEKGEYIELSPDERGSIESRVFPGLALDLEATIDLDLGRVLTVLQSRFNTPEHQQLIDRLASA